MLSLPMDPRAPSLSVRAAAGELLGILSKGPATSNEIQEATGLETRMIRRALAHMETWGIGLQCKEQERTGVCGMRPHMYSLDDERMARLAIRSITGIDRPAPIQAIVAVGLAVEAGR